MAAGRCSFCGRRDTEVPTLVAGPGGVAICPNAPSWRSKSSGSTDPRFDGDLLVTGIGRLVTNDPVGDDLIGEVPDAALAVRDGKVAVRRRRFPTGTGTCPNSTARDER